MKTIHIIANFVGRIFRLFPRKIRVNMMFILFVLNSRGKNPKKALQELFNIEDKLNLVINERAMKLGDNVHPKHDLVPYHSFFIENIKDGTNVLDIGCGYGAVARSIAVARPNCFVLGVDNDLTRFTQAQSFQNPMNLKFTLQDLNQELSGYSQYKWDYVVLSNVLEHMEDRVRSLIEIKKYTKARFYLIRVPLFERDWKIPMRKKIGVNYFQDNDHKIEHTILEFESEITRSNLSIIKMGTLWGEIWAVAENAS